MRRSFVLRLTNRRFSLAPLTLVPFVKFSGCHYNIGMFAKVREQPEDKDQTITGVIAAMAALNEERYIGTQILKAGRYAKEVIVCDDGSTDSTAEIARLAGATVIRHEKNLGKGAWKWRHLRQPFKARIRRRRASCT